MWRVSLIVIMTLLSGLPVAWAGARSDARAGAGAPGRDARPVGTEDRTGPLEPELIKRTIHTYLEREWGHRVKTIQITLFEPSEPIPRPAGLMDLHVIPSSADHVLGRRTFHVAVRANGKPWKTIDALTDVAATIDAVVPTRLLKAEELIDAEDVMLSPIRIHELNHPFMTEKEEAIGKSAARPLQPETPIRPTFLKKPLMVKKGDRVMIEAKRGGLSIQTSGISKASGQAGQTVMVVNLDSGRELRATVVAPGLVHVEF